MLCGPTQPTEVRVTQQTSQLWEGWGTSLAWFGHALGHDPSSRDIVCQLLFAKSHLGLNIVRYNIGGSNQEHVQDYRPGAAIPCFVQPNGIYDWSVDAGQVSMLLAAAELGADTFEAFVNSPPWFWTVSGSSRGHQHPLRSNLEKSHIQDYAKFCADVVGHFKSAHGITFRSLSAFNEPASPAWCLAANCKQEACYFSTRRAHKVLQALREQPGLQDTELVAFEQFCIADTLKDLRHTPKELRPAIARVNTHTYDSSTFFHGAAKPLVLLQDNSLARRRLRKLLQKCGDVPLWVSEFGTGRGALQLAKHVVKDLATLLPCAWVYWQAVEGPGSGWGLLELPIEHPGPQAAAAVAEHCDSSARGSGPAAASSAAAVQAAAALSGRPDVAEPDAGASSASLQEGVCAAGQRQQEQEHQAAVLHPNYFVLQFLVQAVPVGSRLCRVKGLGKHGFAVWRPAGSTAPEHWSLVCINPSTSRPYSFRVTADSFKAVLKDASDTGFGQPVKQGSLEGTAVHKGSQRAASDAVAPAQSPSGDGSVVVHLLDVAALQPVTATVGKAPAMPAAPSMTTHKGDRLSGHVVTVPSGCLCRLDWLPSSRQLPSTAVSH